MVDEAEQQTFPSLDEKQIFSSGVLPSQALIEAVDQGVVKALDSLESDQIQPASIDLRLGPLAYEVPASFLPGPNYTVQQKVADFADHVIDLEDGAVLERNRVYVVPLLEFLDLKKISSARLSATANPKSSTGRLDVFTRIITDFGAEFDRIPTGYSGPLWAEISPRSFAIQVSQGTRLAQLRIRRGVPPTDDTTLRRLHAETPLVRGGPGADNISKGIGISVDAAGDPATGLIGYKARDVDHPIDVAQIGVYPSEEFWEPVYRSDRGLVLDLDGFYILASKEKVAVPAGYAAELVPYDTAVGEVRIHYAGFFDPGFGIRADAEWGTRAVLEVRCHEVPFLVEDGQIVGRLVYERLVQESDRPYGAAIGSNYADQGLALSKHFQK